MKVCCVVFSLTEAEPVSILEALKAAFPFKAAKQRPDEPPRPSLIYCIHDAVRTEEDRKQTGDWHAWAENQPDGPLLFRDMTQREDWIWEKGAIPPAVLKQWRMKRFESAQLIRKRGYGDTLDTYWSDNNELREPPPGFVYTEDTTS